MSKQSKQQQNIPHQKPLPSDNFRKYSTKTEWSSYYIYRTIKLIVVRSKYTEGSITTTFTTNRSVSHQKFAPAIFSRQATIDQVLYVFDWDFIPVFLDLDAQLLLYERTKREGLVSKDNRVDHRFKL